MKRLGFLFAIALVAHAGPALAHAHLVSSDPKANAVLKAGPKAVTLTFNEQLVPAFSKLSISMPEHHMAVAVKSSVARDGKHLVGAVPTRLAAGAYAIAWTAVAADGHKMTGTVPFKVG